MATQSSILAWRIPWTEEPGGLQFIESQELDITKPPSQVCNSEGFIISYTNIIIWSYITPEPVLCSEETLHTY